MVAPTDCEEKPKSTTGNRVSKPLMEKKRRARINKCLDQLKVLLENYYSSSIRKRKLEKADILELTVKHLRSLQRNPRFPRPAAEFPDFKSGFHSCLANFHQYLLLAENLSVRDRSTLSRLSAQLRGSTERRDLSSTMDSSRVPVDARDEPRRPLPSPPGAGETQTDTLKHHKSRPCYFSQDSRTSTKHARVKPLSSRTAAAAQSSVWRPW